MSGKAAQTSEPVESPAGVSRTGRFCLSSSVLETFIHLSNPSSLFPLLTTGSDSWLDYRTSIGLILIVSSFFSRFVYWIRYTWIENAIYSYIKFNVIISFFYLLFQVMSYKCLLYPIFAKPRWNLPSGSFIDPIFVSLKPSS